MKIFLDISKMLTKPVKTRQNLVKRQRKSYFQVAGINSSFQPVTPLNEFFETIQEI